MTEKTYNNEKLKNQVVYVKPVLSFDQIVEIIDDRITFLDKVAKEREDEDEDKMKKK